MNPDSAAARWRYLVLLSLRWFPVGFLIPITVLLPLERGLSLSEVGVVFAAQGILVLALALPTGGLSDSWGRRPVLLLSSVVGIAALGLLVVADSFGEFLVVCSLQGVYRALDSGPLEAWYIDATLTADPAPTWSAVSPPGARCSARRSRWGRSLPAGSLPSIPFRRSTRSRCRCSLQWACPS